MATTGLVTRTVTITSQGANGDTLTTTYDLSGNSEFNFSASVAPGSAVQFAFSIPHTDITCFDATVTGGNATLDFNSSGSPVPALALTPTNPAHWDTNAYAIDSTAFPNPFTADVTGVYITNTAQVEINLSFLLNVVA